MTAARKILFLLLVIVTGISVSGCFQVNGEFRRIRNQAFTGLKDDFYKDTEFAFGSFTMPIIRKIVLISEKENNDKETSEIIKNISELQVGVYKRTGSENGNVDHSVMDKICSNMEEKGWTRIVKNHDRREASVVMIRANSKKLTDMFIIALDRKGLVLTNIRGNLNKILESAIKDKGLKLDNHS